MPVLLSIQNEKCHGIRAVQKMVWRLAENPEKASKIVNADGSPEILKLYVEEMYNPSGTATLKRAYQLQNIESQQLEVTGSTNNRLAVSSTADIHTVADLFQAVKQRNKKFSPTAEKSIPA